MAFQYGNDCKRPCDVVWTLKLKGNQMSKVREHISGSGRGGCHRIREKKKIV
jgi:hypothetical protein